MYVHTSRVDAVLSALEMKIKAEKDAEAKAVAAKVAAAAAAAAGVVAGVPKHPPTAAAKQPPVKAKQHLPPALTAPKSPAAGLGLSKLTDANITSTFLFLLKHHSPACREWETHQWAKTICFHILGHKGHVCDEPLLARIELLGKNAAALLTN